MEQSTFALLCSTLVCAFKFLFCPLMRIRSQVLYRVQWILLLSLTFVFGKTGLLYVRQSSITACAASHLVHLKPGSCTSLNTKGLTPYPILSFLSFLKVWTKIQKANEDRGNTICSSCHVLPFINYWQVHKVRACYVNNVCWPKFTPR